MTENMTKDKQHCVELDDRLKELLKQLHSDDQATIPRREAIWLINVCLHYHEMTDVLQHKLFHLNSLILNNHSLGEKETTI